MKEIYKAIEHFEHLQKRYTTQHNGKHCELVKTALAALREKAEREREREREKAKGCEYCLTGKHFMSDGEPIYIFENQIVAQSYNESDNVAEINFCPMCGKRLEVEHD